MDEEKVVVQVTLRPSELDWLKARTGVEGNGPAVAAFVRLAIQNRGGK